MPLVCLPGNQLGHIVFVRELGGEAAGLEYRPAVQLVFEASFRGNCGMAPRTRPDHRQSSARSTRPARSALALHVAKQRVKMVDFAWESSSHCRAITCGAYSAAARPSASGYRKVSWDYCSISLDCCPAPEVPADTRVRVTASTTGADGSKESLAEGLDTMS
jgi:hypothetical protein